MCSKEVLLSFWTLRIVQCRSLVKNWGGWQCQGVQLQDRLHCLASWSAPRGLNVHRGGCIPMHFWRLDQGSFHTHSRLEAQVCCQMARYHDLAPAQHQV